MPAAIKIENVSKRYRIGEVGTGTLSHDLNRAWAKLQGKPDPYATVGVENDREVAGGDYVWALTDVNLDVEEGEILGIIGRNGAGKSTLLKLLSRVTGPSQGSIKARGRIASLLEVGTGFHPELTGRENIYLNGAILGMRRHEVTNRLDEIVEFSGCAKYLDTPVKRYSSGMMVRLGFAVAAHLECEILIVDEVLAVGDAEFQKKCLGKMKDVAGHGRTVLIVSHNMASIRNLCSRAVLIRQGKLAVSGPVESVIPRYLQDGTDQGGMFIPGPEDVASNDKVRLISAEVTQEHLDGPSSDIDISQDVIIRITYECLQDGLRLYTAIWLKDGMGTVVLCSGNAPDFNLNQDPWYGVPHPVGAYTTEGRIPGNFLNYGRYLITPIVGIVSSDPDGLILEDRLTFDVHDTGSMRKTYYGERIGVVHPPFQWSTSQASPPLQREGMDRPMPL